MAAPEKAYVWYDPEGDFLDVVFLRKDGFFEPTENDRVVVKRDNEGNILGFQIQGVRHLRENGKQPFEVELKARDPEKSE